MQDLAEDSLLLMQNTGTENDTISKFRMAYWMHFYSAKL